MTTPLDWRAHLTEDEAEVIKKLDKEIAHHRAEASYRTKRREEIRRRVSPALRYIRRKELIADKSRKNGNGGIDVPLDVWLKQRPRGDKK